MTSPLQSPVRIGLRQFMTGRRESGGDDGRPARGFEYLDHTADVQLHAWGVTLKEAFEEAAKAMFAYMTDLDSVEERGTVRYEVRASDMESALFRFLDEALFHFSADPFFVPFKVDITRFEREGGDVVIEAVGLGEPFQLGKHPQGMEVKAITYSAMQINETDGHAEVFVIVDI